MMNDYETIIWDMNGTLVDDVELCIEIANVFLRKEGLTELTKESYQAEFGFPITAYYERIGIDLEKNSMESLTEQFIYSYMTSVKNCQLQGEVERIIIDLDRAQKTQFVLTAAHTEVAMELLNHFGIRKYFKAIAGLDNHLAASKVERGKELMKTHQVNTEKVVLIGDTLHDFEVAQALGVHCILIANGHQSKERLDKGVNGNAIVLEQAEQLINI